MKENYSQTKNIISIGIIFVSICLIIVCISHYFVRKGDYRIWNSFYGLEKNSVDVVFLGSSMIGCALDPYQLSEETGLTCVNMGVSGSTYSVREAFLNEILKTQDIKLLIVETWRYTQWPEMDINNAMYSIGGMRFSKNKLDLILNIPLLSDKYDRFELLFPFFAFHGRWNELSSDDAIPLDVFKADYTWWNDGGHLWIDSQPEIEVNPGTVQELAEVQKKYLDDIINAARENDIEILFFNPQNPDIHHDDYERLNAINDYLTECGVPFIEGNDEAELVAWTDTRVDFCDTHHTSLSGTYKVTGYVADYINNHYNIEGAFTPERDEYVEYVSDLGNRLREEIRPEYYLMLALNDVFNVYVCKNESNINEDNTEYMLLNFDNNMSEEMLKQYFDEKSDYCFRIVIEDKYTGEIVDVREF